jgi:DNA-directed RNA polymerase subunit M
MRLRFDHRRAKGEKAQASEEKVLEENCEPKETVVLEMSAESAGETKKTKKTRFNAKFCPRCGSHDVFWAQGMPQFWSLWQCKNCGYRGPVILENGNLAAKLQEEWAKKNFRNSA